MFIFTQKITIPVNKGQTQIHVSVRNYILIHLLLFSLAFGSLRHKQLILKMFFLCVSKRHSRGI